MHLLLFIASTKLEQIASMFAEVKGIKKAKKADAPPPEASEVVKPKKRKQDTHDCVSEPSKTKRSKNGENSCANPHMFKGYNLQELNIPAAALPQSGKQNGGAHGYTVTSSNNAAPCPKIVNLWIWYDMFNSSHLAGSSSSTASACCAPPLAS